MSLIADLFPGIVLDSATYAELQVAIGNQVENAGLVNHPAWNLKIVQVNTHYIERKHKSCLTFSNSQKILLTLSEFAISSDIPFVTVAYNILDSYLGSFFVASC